MEGTQETRALQKTIPNEMKRGDLTNNFQNISSNTGADMDSTAVPLVRLPFGNFKEKWNAITDAQLSDLYITKLDVVIVGEEYHANLTKQLELIIHVDGNQVRGLTLKAHVENKGERMKMLTGWSQVVMILHPEYEIYDVDALFSELGVGPNADLSQVQEGVYPYHDLQYEITRSENDYIFLATYKES